MAKPKVLVTRRVPESGIQKLREVADVDLWDEDQPIPRDVLLQKVRDIDGIFCLLTERINDELLDAAPKLRVVSNMAVGFDNIDVAACTRRGLPVGNTPGVLTETTADLAFALLMAGARRISEGERYVRAGKWTTWGPLLLMGPDIYGATLGIVGIGRIGQAMARRAKGFDMRVLYHDTQAPPGLDEKLGVTGVDFDRLLEESDFISIHTPLLPSTRHLFSTAQFKKMRPTAVLVNSARGPIIDQRALYEALRDGEIGYAALDVTDPEPIPMDDPLLTLENCLIVPHIGSASVATRNRMSSMAADNLIAGLRGEPLPNTVNPEVRAPKV
ncbi:MAG: D-glycerate dehydrogenase [Anaerolineae bacterium]|nr:D-glycerate dehydrogenase [Anaerolineae bacterium]